MAAIGHGNLGVCVGTDSFFQDIRYAVRTLLPGFGAHPFVLGAALLIAATTLAALWPLRGAARIDPAQALRTE